MLRSLALILSRGVAPGAPPGGARGLSRSRVLARGEDRKEMQASLPKRDEGTAGERSADVDLMIRGKENMFPDENTPDLVFGGVKFSDLPVCHLKISKNNTLITLAEAKGKILLMRSCGMEGFKNTRKGTNIAAQASAVTLSTRAVERGFKNVRVKVRGLGPGRMSAIKGLQMGGLNIVSITDNTPVSWDPPRPRKARRI